MGRNRRWDHEKALHGAKPARHQPFEDPTRKRRRPLPRQKSVSRRRHGRAAADRMLARALGARRSPLFGGAPSVEAHARAASTRGAAVALPQVPHRGRRAVQRMLELRRRPPAVRLHEPRQDRLNEGMIHGGWKIARAGPPPPPPAAIAPPPAPP